MNQPFRWLWTAAASGSLAEGVSLSALPLIMASLTRDPLLIALLQTAAALPWALFGLPAGALVDRWDRARVLFAADTARAGLAAVLGVLVWIDRAHPGSLLAFAFVTSVATVMFRAADAAVLPTLVSSAELPRANARLKTGETVTGNFVGPSLGSVVFTFAPGLPPIIQAATFAISAVCLRRLPRRDEARPRSGLTLRAEVTQGLRHLWADKTLRTLAVATTLHGAGIWMLMAVLVLYSLQTLNAPAAAYGVLITTYAIGSLLGAAASSGVERRLGTRTALAAATLLGGLSIIMLAVTATFAVAAGAMLTLGFAAMTLTIITITLRQRRTPERLLGRVSSAFNVLNVAPAPVVAPISGLISAQLGTPIALTVAGAVFLLATPILAKGIAEPSGKVGGTG